MCFRIEKVTLTILFCYLNILISCKPKERAEVYFENDTTKVLVQSKNGTMSKTKFHYDKFRRLVLKQVLVNDSMKMVTYYDHEKVSYEIMFLDGHRTEERGYYENGKIVERKIVARNGEILEGESYLEDGSRDSTLYPYVFMNMSKDGKIANVRARVLNRMLGTEFTYEPRELLIGGKIDTVSLLVRDTLKIVKPNRLFEYATELMVDSLKRKTIFCQFKFIKEGDSIADVSVIPVPLKQSNRNWGREKKPGRMM